MATVQKTQKRAKLEKRSEERLSALDAAERVLKDRKKPMHVGELIDEMAKRKLWESPGGKTPTATLFAAMLREIAVKGSDSRFSKMDRGLFGLKGKDRRRDRN